MNSQDNWAAKLDGCNFIMAREDISRSLTMLRQEGEEAGGSYYISPEFASALKAFYSEPTFETAVTLLEVAPVFLPMFEFNSPRNPLFAYGLGTYEQDNGNET